MPTTKEQLIYYLLTNISLGTYDKRFLNNVQNGQVATNKPVTTNQSDLVDKIISRYRRQLAKNNLDAADLIALTWSNNLIVSSPVYTEAHLSIMDDNTIILHSPYKATFVKEFREYQFSTWDKENKAWSCPLSETTLREVVTIATKHYDVINYCTEVQQALDTIHAYDDTLYWNPTLVEANGMLYIAAINHSLHEAIMHIELNKDLRTLAKLVQSGVTISDEIIHALGDSEQAANKIAFAVARSCALEYDYELILSYLRSVKTDFVLMSEWFGVNKEFTDKLQHGLTESNINYKMLDRRSDINVNLRVYDLPIILSSWSVVPDSTLALTAAKIITLVNSNPINIK